MKIARTIGHLATALGCSRKTVSSWLKKADCPGRRADGSFSVARWQKWIQENGLGSRTTASDRHPILEPLKREKLKLQSEKIRLETDALELQNQIARGELIKNDAACQVVVAGFSHTVTALRSMKHRINGLVAGRTPGDAERIIDREIREALAQWEIPRGLENHPFFGPLRKKLKDLNAELATEGGV